MQLRSDNKAQAQAQINTRRPIVQFRKPIQYHLLQASKRYPNDTWESHQALPLKES
jgi:hypothetical protein